MLLKHNNSCGYKYFLLFTTRLSTLAKYLSIYQYHITKNVRVRYKLLVKIKILKDEDKSKKIVKLK